MIDLSWDRNNAVNWDWVEPLALGLLFMFVLPGGGWTTDYRLPDVVTVNHLHGTCRSIG